MANQAIKDLACELPSNAEDGVAIIYRLFRSKKMSKFFENGMAPRLFC